MESQNDYGWSGRLKIGETMHGQKTAIEKLRQEYLGASVWESINLQRECIFELADDLKEQKRVFEQHAKIEKNFRQNTRIRIKYLADQMDALGKAHNILADKINGLPVKSEPDVKWPRVGGEDKSENCDYIYILNDISKDNIAEYQSYYKFEKYLPEFIRCYNEVHGHK